MNVTYTKLPSNNVLIDHRPMFLSSENTIYIIKVDRVAAGNAVTLMSIFAAAVGSVCLSVCHYYCGKYPADFKNSFLQLLNTVGVSVRKIRNQF